LRSIRLALLLLAFPALWSCGRPAEAADADRAAVTTAVERYFRGHATGDGAHFRQAFHPDARIFSVKEGKVASLSRDEFAARASGKPAADESRRKRRIVSIDIAGDAAVAKVDLDYPDVHFIDYLSLLRVDGSWIIINKVFHRAQPSR
jgi:hypothetical protein